MRSRPRRRWLAQSAAIIALAVATPLALAGSISPELERALATRGTHADTAIIIRFADPIDLGQVIVADRRVRDNRVWLALKARSSRNFELFEPVLAAQGAKGISELWIVNGVAATVPALAVRELAQDPRVARIDLDSFAQGGRPQQMPARRTPPQTTPTTTDSANVPAPALRAAPGWNIAAVQAPEMWALGHTGRGVVVAVMDTGVDLSHPDLRGRWRGGTNSWFDPHGEEASPYDAIGHGTRAMGIIVGGSTLGVAPDARWIAVKLYDANGHARMSDIHRAFQWLMDPDGDPGTVDSPDIVSGSWTLSGRRAGACNLEFSEDLQALRSAGIAVAFAAGNDGPSPSTSNSPGNNPHAFSVGAVDRDLEVGRQTSRGPSACDGSLFPSVAAPGVGVRTTDLSHGGLRSLATVSGSSLAAPHVAGVLALLAGALPAAPVAELEGSLLRSAKDLGDPGPDNVYGAGLVRALAAFESLLEDHGAASSERNKPERAPGTHNYGRAHPDALNAMRQIAGAM